MRDAISALLAAALVLGSASWSSNASAQGDAGSVDAAAQSSDASTDEGGVQVDPRTGRRFREVRPPEGLRRGRFSSPAWAVGGLGALTAAAALAALVWRRRRSK